MINRLPATLWRHTLSDLWRVLVLTTVILVTVIAFSMAVQLMAAGKIGPGDMPRLMALAAIPMLQYALPFAAGFSATLAYHRMTQDLEVTACSAGGISHRAILAPAALSGVILAGGLIALNEQVIPRFLRGIERLVTEDAMQLMVQSFERGEAVAWDDFMIAADHIFVMEPPDGAEDYLILERVIALGLRSDGSVESEAQAELAHVWYYTDTPVDGEGTLAMRMVDAIASVEGESYMEGRDVDLAKVIPDAFSDDPKFLTFGELRNLRTEPRRMKFVEQRRRKLAVHLGARQSLESLVASLRTVGAATLIGPDGRTLRVRARNLRFDHPSGAWLFVPQQDQPIALELSAAGTSGAQLFEANAATLSVNLGGDEGATALSFDVEVRDYTVRSANAENASGTRTTFTWAGLRTDPDPMPALLDLSTGDILELARPRVESLTPDAFVKAPHDDLVKRLAKLSREITSKQHERMAMAAACLVMVLTGSVMAMRLGTALPLTVYLWSFFPALATVITISSGQQLTHKNGPIGLVLLWGGVAALAAYTLVAFKGLRRH